MRAVHVEEVSFKEATVVMPDAPPGVLAFIRDAKRQSLRSTPYAPLSGCYCRNRKNWIEFKIGTVTMCCPFCRTGAFVTGDQVTAA